MKEEAIVSVKFGDDNTNNKTRRPSEIGIYFADLMLHHLETVRKKKITLTSQKTKKKKKVTI